MTTGDRVLAVIRWVTLLVMLLILSSAVGAIRRDVNEMRRDTLRCAQVAEDQRFVCE